MWVVSNHEAYFLKAPVCFDVQENGLRYQSAIRGKEAAAKLLKQHAHQKRIGGSTRNGGGGFARMSSSDPFLGCV